MARLKARTTRGLAWLLLAGSGVSAIVAQTAAKTDAGTISVLMLSDLHFDPFRDEAKVARLANAPVSGWEAILKEPASASAVADFAALQKTCGAKGADTDYALLISSLKAERTHAAGSKFVTISGDLLVHQFDCRFKTIMKSDDKAAYSAFAEKTASYLIERVEQEFPGAAVYVALGNNDSGCGDYAMDARDRFLSGTSGAVIGGLRGASAAEVKQAREDYDAAGYFGVTLAAPMRHTRLLVVDDLFLSKRYTNCAEKAGTATAESAEAWLKRELDEATRHGERVWVMGHIPPGIDVVSTLKKGDVCAGAKSETYLAPDAQGTLGDVLAAHADVIRLAIFGHTHMDEMKLLQADGGGAVPLKGVPSITPVNGNLPAFTVAQIDPENAVMKDYTVYVASNKTGVDTTWTREYGFAETYGQKSFTPAALETVISGFRADPGMAAPASQAYLQHFDKGFPISPLMLGWPQYVCGLDQFSAAGYKACLCAAGK